MLSAAEQMSSVCAPSPMTVVDPTVDVNLNLLGQPQPDNYTFTVDATGFPGVRPTVTVTRDSR